MWELKWKIANLVMKHVILRRVSQDLSTRNGISEDTARSELEAMERDARYALFCQDQPFKIAVREHQRQARVGCERIRGLRSSDDARNSRSPESIRRTNGRTWEKSGTDDWVRSTGSFAWSEKPHVARTQARRLKGGVRPFGVQGFVFFPFFGLNYSTISCNISCLYFFEPSRQMTPWRPSPFFSCFFCVSKKTGKR